MTKIGISGAAGRMGKELIQAIYATESLELSQALVEPNSSLNGKNISTHLGIANSSINFSGALTENMQVLIDFSLPDASIKNLDFCIEHKLPLVIGTTGFSEEQKGKIEAGGKKIPIILAPNMSVGVNVCLQLVNMATKLLGAEYDIEILDIHHRHKIDSPSGTALALGEAVAEARGEKLAEVAIYERHSKREARGKNQIGFACMRMGDYVGEHRVIFSTLGETVEIVHKASSRATFAMGALRAAVWLLDKPAGFYNMQDVLGLRR